MAAAWNLWKLVQRGRAPCTPTTRQSVPRRTGVRSTDCRYSKYMTVMKSDCQPVSAADGFAADRRLPAADACAIRTVGLAQIDRFWRPGGSAALSLAVIPEPPGRVPR